MNKNHIQKAGAVAAGILMIAGPILAFAQTTGVAASSTRTQNQQARITQAIQRADQEIARRITSLNTLQTRVSGMKRVSNTEKTTIANEVQSEIASLTTLKAKIDADTDVTTLRTDIKSIATSYRIYMLVIPQGAILVAADRALTVTTTLDTINTKLAAAIAQAQQAGKNVSSLQTALADMNAKNADAKTQIVSAQNGVTGLTPDNGNQAQATANHAAMVAARANLKNARQDFAAARQDAHTIVQGLHALSIKTSTASTTSSQ